jgi:hypothetical protein
MNYPREVLNDWRRQLVNLISTAHSSHRFNLEKIYGLIDASDQSGIVNLLLDWARDIHELYLFPYGGDDENLMPEIIVNIDKITNKQLTK